MQKFLKKRSEHNKFHKYKFSTQQVPWTKSVSRGEKSMYKLYQEKNWHAIGFEIKNQNTTSSTNKKPANNYVHEQNQFQEEEKQCTSFTMR